ncbi:hypothetical protein SAMN02745857_01482 [Andreprevotia lacus DSM 23236]|jgi:hypothetical protein|uniref:Uncharacterized protein n=1 Tax=Andreprevotia lacus DSM 23236 TaxID=1121001 RepID=A0A1W1XH43_9NEIS|nr:hypothetical protein [Andreprevotia lacus]SMC22831.1 hypothetical protein SAMN02745857_01482 [Andreprevotia lacus DSM 23236]
MYKNADVSWGGFQPVGQTLEEVHQAFKYGKAEKRLLPAGMKICRLHGFSQLAPGTVDSTLLTAWWSPYDAYDWDAGIQERRKLASHFGVSTRELSRIVMAVKEDWNSLAYLWVATLTQPINVFFGIVAGQARSGGGTMRRDASVEKSGGTSRLAGNNAQFYIPNLLFSDIRDSQFLPL